jgi:hypothetical protein
MLSSLLLYLATQVTAIPDESARHPACKVLQRDPDDEGDLNEKRSRKFCGIPKDKDRAAAMHPHRR